MTIAGVVRNSLRRRQSLREATRLTRATLATATRPKRSVPGLVHVPKTGGTSLTRFNESSEPTLWPLMNFRHRVVAGQTTRRPPPAPADADSLGRHFGFRGVIARPRAERHFLIAACRNPFDLLVSFREATKGASDSRDFAIVGGFGDWLKHVAEREYPWPGGRFHGGLLHHQFFDLDGVFVIDWVLRNETLDADAAALADHLNVAFRPSGRTNESTRQRDYRAYYTDELRELVERVWGDDLALCGYTFDGPVERPLLHRRVSDGVRGSLRYDRATGALTMPAPEPEPELELESKPKPEPDPAG